MEDKVALLGKKPRSYGLIVHGCFGLLTDLLVYSNETLAELTIVICYDDPDVLVR